MPAKAPAAPVLTLGIDPGRAGAAVLVRGQHGVVAAAAWGPCQRGGAPRYRLRCCRPYRSEQGLASWAGDAMLPGRPGSVGVALAQFFGTSAAGQPVAVACEDVYLGKNARSALALAKWAGGLVAALEECCGASAEWVPADTWRAAVLGLRRGTARAGAKAASSRYVPARLPEIRPALEYLGGGDHVTDAAGVALWRATRR